jgi:hypothetical protein
MEADGITRRDVAQFDQFLDSHREIAEQLRKTPTLVEDQQYRNSHPELYTYLREHPNVREVISQHPDTFMRLEDIYAHNTAERDRDAGGQGGGQGGQAAGQPGQDRNAGGQDRDANRGDDADRRDDGDRRDVAEFARFLDDHREIAEQVRKDPNLLVSRTFEDNHPALHTYLEEHAGVREQIRQHPDAFMRQEDAFNRDSNMRDHDPMHDHMADFGGFLHNHSDIRSDLSRNPSVVKDNQYVQNHTELHAYLNAHPDIRAELMANPQDFVHGAQQYETGGSGRGAGMTGSGSGTTGTGTTGTTGTTGSTNGTGTSTNPPTTTHEPTKPNQ